MPRRHISHRRGIALIWVAITLFVLLAMIGLAMDASIAVFGRQQLQDAADAAALGGAALVKVNQDEARDKAQEVALANTVYGTDVALDRNEDNADTGDIVVGYYDRNTSVFAPTEIAPNAMKVVARRSTGTQDGPIPLVFGHMVNTPNVDVEAEAIAIVHGGTGAGMIVLDPNDNDDCAADFGGTVTISVTDITVEPNEPGTIQVNSEYCGDKNGAICVNGNVSVDAGDINIVGCADDDLEGIVDPDQIHEGESPIVDPLASLPPVDTINMDVIPIASGTAPMAPVAAGYHGPGVKLNGGMLTLESGIHVFDSRSLDIKSIALEVVGNAGIQTVEGGGVLLYIAHGSVVLAGSGGVKLDPLDAPVGTPDAAYNGITIFQARNNYCETTINGGNGLDLTGTLYFPNNLVNIGGGGTGYGNQLIAWRISTFGTGEIKIMYDGSFPAPGFDVFLVK